MSGQSTARTRSWCSAGMFFIRKTAACSISMMNITESLLFLSCTLAVMAMDTSLWSSSSLAFFSCRLKSTLGS